MIPSSEWEEIYRQYSGRVMGYITARVQRREDAEDLCAEVFAKAFRKMDNFDRERAAVGTWIFTITRNTVIDYYRTRKPTAELDEKLAGEFEVDGSIIQEETLKELAAAIRTLPPELRDIIVMVYEEKKTLLEVSKIIHFSYRTVKLRHQKALGLLRESLENK